MQTVTIFLFVIVLGFCKATPLGIQGSKIVGGVETNIEDVPYQLQMERLIVGSQWVFSCGGVIIGKDFVLTAGHCVDGSEPKTLKYFSGDSNRGKGTVHNVTAITVHPNYVDLGGYADYDIAVVKITPPFEFDNTTQPIKLIDAQPAAGANATVSGWGTMSENSGQLPTVVRKVVVPIVDQKDCVSEYDEIATVSDNMLCAGLAQGGKDSCSGDSGGPLVVDGALAGLVSWGYGCAVAGYAGVYTNVAPFRSWVQEQIDNL